MPVGCMFPAVGWPDYVRVVGDSSQCGRSTFPEQLDWSVPVLSRWRARISARCKLMMREPS